MFPRHPDLPTQGLSMKLLSALPCPAPLQIASSARAAGPFKDPALEKVVRAVLQFPTGDLTDEKLKNVHIVTEASGKGIKDLSGMEKCTNLKELRIAKNEITDVKPLAGMTDLQ